MKRLMIAFLALVPVAIVWSDQAANGPQRVEVGQEWRYGGTVTISMSQGEAGPARPGGFPRFILSASATVVGRAGGSLEVVRFRSSQIEIRDAAEGVVWIAGPDGKAPRGADMRYGPPEFLSPDDVALPVPFGTGLKPGHEATGSVRFLGDSSSEPMPARVRVTGEEKIGSRLCLRIERTPIDKLPIARRAGEASGEEQIDQHSERFWIDRQSGVLVKYEAHAGVSSGLGGQRIQAQFSFALSLKGVRTLPAAELRSRRTQAQSLSDILEQVTALSGSPDEEQQVRQTRQRLARFQRANPKSPYLVVAKGLDERLEMVLAQMEQNRKLAALVGKPAPAIRLNDLDGKERTFGEFQGKIILLNFFASW